jgi:ethanolamine utilization protein EutP (predicted NTPase)
VIPLCDPTFLPRLTGRVEAWIEQPGPANNRLTLVGRKGSGVTSLVDYLQHLYRERVQFARVNLQDRQLDLFHSLASALKLDSVPESLEQAAELLRQRPATVLVIENFHFLFLSALGGFQSLRNALLLARMTPHNVFWMFTGGYHAQAYLNRVLVADFVSDFWLQVPLWSEQALRKAILHAHQASGLKLTFDPDLGSFPEETGADQGLETQYFRILWEHSGGNPSTARHLYLRSLDPSEDGLVATLPPSNQVSRLQAAPTAMHLVLAAVMRHQGLTEGEVARVTDLEGRVVQLSLMQALEWGVLECDHRGMHAVHPAWVKDLEVLLKRKNMLYAL